VTVEENKVVIRRLCEEVFNQRNLELIDELYSSEFVQHPGLPTSPRGPERARCTTTQFLDAFPDARVTVLHMVAEGDMVATRVKAEGTHRPTGKPVTIPFAFFYRLEEGKVVEEWGLTDNGQLQAQLE
jgi:predicted ester cyclase